MTHNLVQIIIIASMVEKSSSSVSATISRDNNTRDREPNIGKFQFINLVIARHSNRIILRNATTKRKHVQNE